MTSWYHEDKPVRDYRDAPVELNPRGELIIDGEIVPLSSIGMCMYHFAVGNHAKGLAWLPATWFRGPLDLEAERAEGISVDPNTTVADFLRRVAELRN